MRLAGHDQGMYNKKHRGVQREQFQALMTVKRIFPFNSLRVHIML